MKLLPHGAALARILRSRWSRRNGRRPIPVRTSPMPVRLERQGGNYRLIDGLGRTIGKILAPETAPRLGRHEQTLYLWREN